ncbi:MAG TPA: FlgD immunoglobulin-like domain containing protein [Candidatus Sulfotelmatobacter sp.]|nr:FlgD immunoglobulin-like domain containing protein [Candidatus Sulfotelmatobacter sp.]
MRAVLKFTLPLALALTPGESVAQSVQSNLWVTNGPVYAIARMAGEVYIGGAFTQVGPPIGGFATIDGATGAIQTPYAEVDGIVNASIPDGSGGRFIGGRFSHVQGQPHSCLAHLDPSGNVTSWDAGVFDASDGVRALAIDPFNPTVLYVGGAFTYIGLVSYSNLVAVDVNTAALLPWSAGTDGKVNALWAYDGTIYAAGAFFSADGAQRHSLAAFDAFSSLRSWNPDVNGQVYAIAGSVAPLTHAVTLWVGGDFSQIAGQQHYTLASIPASSSTPNTWNASTNGTVKAIALGYFRNNVVSVYVGGTFSQAGGHSLPRLAQLDAFSGTPSTTFTPGPSDEVDALLLDGGTLYAGGRFDVIGLTAHGRIAALDAATGVATDWNPMLNAPVNCVDESGGTVWAGGSFSSAGGVNCSNLVALDATTGVATWTPGVNGEVDALATDGSTMYVGGAFTFVGIQGRGFGAAFDSNHNDTGWNPRADGTIHSVLPYGGSVYVGGSFLTLDNNQHIHLGQVDPSSGAAGPEFPPVLGDVLAMVVHSNRLYVGGQFGTVGSSPRGSGADFDLSTHALGTWDPRATNGVVPAPIYAIAEDGNTLIIGGDFYQLGGGTRFNLGQVDDVAGSATAWAAPVTGQFYALQGSGSRLYLGGTSGLSALDIGTLDLVAWDPQVDGYVHALAVASDRLYVGGSFYSAGGTAYSNLATYSGGVTAVSATRDVARGLKLSANPSRGPVTIGFALPARATTDAGIYDLSGRLVRRLRSSVLEAGEQRVTWDGRDESGGRVNPGVYFARVSAGSFQSETRLVRLQ